jgi:hypothetical protein
VLAADDQDVNAVDIALVALWIGLFLDAGRHVVLAWKAFFGWQLSMPRAQRRSARSILGRAARRSDNLLGRFDAYFGLDAMDDAPPEAASNYKHHARRLFVDGALLIAVSALIQILPS